MPSRRRASDDGNVTRLAPPSPTNVEVRTGGGQVLQFPTVPAEAAPGAAHSSPDGSERDADGPARDPEKVHNKALKLLRYKDRSEHELTAKLLDAGFDAVAVDTEIERLRAAGLIDDVRVAEMWAEQRQRSSPRSRRMLAMELQRRGISADAAQQAVAGFDDRAAALAAGTPKARSVRKAGDEKAKKRLAAFLQRRGFDYQTVDAVMAELLPDA